MGAPKFSSSNIEERQARRSVAGSSISGILFCRSKRAIANKMIEVLALSAAVFLRDRGFFRRFGGRLDTVGVTVGGGNYCGELIPVLFGFAMGERVGPPAVVVRCGEELHNISKGSLDCRAGPAFGPEKSSQPVEKEGYLEAAGRLLLVLIFSQH